MEDNVNKKKNKYIIFYKYEYQPDLSVISRYNHLSHFQKYFSQDCIHSYDITLHVSTQ